MDAQVTRQFACGSCRKKWWKDVCGLNPVCECYSCGSILKAIPRDKEYGVGLHECGCGHVFHGRTKAGVPSPCYQCGENCYPKIIPNKAGVNKKSKNVHKCVTCGGRGDCIHFNEIIHTSQVVEHASDDEEDEDNYEPDDGDDDEDGYDYNEYYDEYDSEGQHQDEEDPFDYLIY